MQMKLDRVSAPAGPVTFQARNGSKTLVHELIVIEDTGPLSALPYDAKKDVASEDKFSSLGEVPELPGFVARFGVALSLAFSAWSFASSAA